MPTEVLTQLRALRESIADALRKDPRYLTLTALDRTIAEISGVLGTSGVTTLAAAPAALDFDAPSAEPAATEPMPEAPAPDLPPQRDIEKKQVSAPPFEVPGVTTGGLPEARDDSAGISGSPTDAVAPSTAEEARRPADEEPVAIPARPDIEAKAEAADGLPAPKPKVSGYIPMQPKPGALQYQPAMSVKFGKLPNKVDLRPLMTPIDDQGDLNSCVANAVAAAYEYWIKKASKQDHAISRLFVYYNARWRDGLQDAEEGGVIQFALEGLMKFGACNEQAWPLEARLAVARPGAEAYHDGAPYRIHDMAQVPLKLEMWKQALAEGKPIIFGCEIFESFNDCSKQGGIVLTPEPSAISQEQHGVHAMCVVGYSETEQVFIVRNSWGADFGDQGYCYMPFAYLMNPKLNDGDCWVFVPKVPSQPPREVWSDDTNPVTNGGAGVDFPIESGTTGAYDKIEADLVAAVRRPFNTSVPDDFSIYAGLAAKNMWTEMESADVPTLMSAPEPEGLHRLEAQLAHGSPFDEDIAEDDDDKWRR